MHKPYMIQFEIANYCNLSCEFCAAKYIKSLNKPKKLLSFDFLKSMIDDIEPWLGDEKIRIDFTGGVCEPFLNDKIFEFARYTREKIPNSYIMVYSNGTLLDKKKIERWFENSNQLYIDCYSESIFNNFKERIEDLPYEKWVYNTSNNQFTDIESGKKIDECFYAHRGKRKVIGLLTSFKKPDKHSVKRYHNFAGNIPRGVEGVHYNVNLDHSCHEPFKNMQVRLNGVVPLCCNAICNDLVMGKFPEKSLKEIWDSEIIKKCRYILKYGNPKRRLFPCCVCSKYRGVRMGLEKPDIEEGSIKEWRAIQEIQESQEKYEKYKDDLYFEKKERWEKEHGLKRWYK